MGSDTIDTNEMQLQVMLIESSAHRRRRVGDFIFRLIDEWTGTSSRPVFDMYCCRQYHTLSRAKAYLLSHRTNYAVIQQFDRRFDIAFDS